MATPALRAIRTQFPRSEIVAVVRPYVQEVLNGLDLVDRYLVHDPRGKSSALRGWAFGQALRRERLDLAVLFPNSFRSAFWAWWSGAKTRVGFDRYRRGWLLTDRLMPKSINQPNPVIDEYLRLAEHLGCPDLTCDTELATTGADEKQHRKFWDAHGGWPQRGAVCLNPGGAFGSAKHWPVTSFAQLALRIATELNRQVLVLCGPAEKTTAREIVALARHSSVVSLAEAEPSIGLTKAAIKHASLLVTTDSGPRHFAQPFQVPVVTLFGPTHAAWSETYYHRSLHLQLEMDCGPCQQRTCPLQHHRCLRDLSPDWVFRAAASLLERTAEPHAA